MPALGLAISGGNTLWVDMPEYGRYEVLGETLDGASLGSFFRARYAQQMERGRPAAAQCRIPLFPAVLRGDLLHLPWRLNTQSEAKFIRS